MPRPLWFETPAGAHLYVAAEKDPDGWVVRVFDRNGKSMSRLVYRVSNEMAADETMSELPAEIVSDLMHEMRRQVISREEVFLAQPVK